MNAIELVLRNSIHRAMVQKYAPTTKPNPHSVSEEWWFDAETAQGALLDSRDYAKVEAARQKIVNSPRTLTTSRVVAELSFGFWVELLNPEYETTIVRPLLGATMRKLKAVKRTQGSLRDAFGRIRDLRNRVMHHEMICHRADLQQINHLAWQIVTEIDPWQAQLLRGTCRFDKVWAQSWQPYYDRLESEAKTMFDQHKAQSD